MFNISNITREDNPYRGHARCTATTRFDTWTMLVAYSRTPARRIRLRTFLAVGAGVLADQLISLPRRTCDRLFAMNDAEARWRGWQTVSVPAGYRRRYRDPGFDTLDEVGTNFTR